MSDHIPWNQMYLIAIREIGIQPSEFWQLTLMEYLLLLPDCHVDGDNLRSSFKAMQEQFPDTLTHRYNDDNNSTA